MFKKRECEDGCLKLEWGHTRHTYQCLLNNVIRCTYCDTTIGLFFNFYNLPVCELCLYEIENRGVEIVDCKEE